MKYSINGEIRKISLKVWNGTSLSPDFFYDLELAGNDPENDEGERVVTPERYAEILEYWTSEVEAANRGEWSEQFGNWKEEHPDEELILAEDLL